MSAADRPAYRVVLPVFEGPLDLLLHLIEREELDITLVSLAQVTNQYLEYVARLEETDLDGLAAFLVVAARLLLIKSRALLPAPAVAGPLEETEEEDGESLVRQLVEYRRFKAAARWLQELEARGQQAYVRLAAPPAVGRSLELDEVTLGDLLEAVRRVLAAEPAAPSVNGTIPQVTVTVAEQMERIEDEVGRRQVVVFSRLVEGARSRLEVIVTLLALLELIKQRRVAARQDRLFGEIVIVPKQAVADRLRTA